MPKSRRSRNRSAFATAIASLSCAAILYGSESTASEITPDEILQRAGIPTDCRSLLATLRDRDAAYRSIAAHALGRNAECGALEVLRERLSDPDPVVRTGALLGLGAIKDPIVMDELRESALTGPTPDVRQAALNAIRSIGGHAALEALLHVARDTTQSQSLRINAVSAMFRVVGNGRPSFPELRPLLGDPDPDIRAQAATLLAESDGLNAIPFLVLAAIDRATGEGERISAIYRLQQLTGEAFGYVGRSRGGPYAEPLGDENARAQSLEAMRAWWDINRLGYPSTAEVLKPAP